VTERCLQLVDLADLLAAVAHVCLCQPRHRQRGRAVASLRRSWRRVISLIGMPSSFVALGR
jgi:hypothetical protein